MDRRQLSPPLPGDIMDQLQEIAVTKPYPLITIEMQFRCFLNAGYRTEKALQYVRDGIPFERVQLLRNAFGRNLPLQMQLDILDGTLGVREP